MPDVHCFYVSEGLLTRTHVERIGPALWEFLWLISHETKMQGKVLNGAPITLSRIAEELGESAITARRNLNRLSKEGYVVRKRNAPGLEYCYTIAHSKKWKVHWEGQIKNDRSSPIKNDRSDSDSPIKNDRRVRSEMIAGPIKNDRANKEDRQLDILDNRDTTCIKCKGLGFTWQFFASDSNGSAVQKMVKCDECSKQA